MKLEFEGISPYWERLLPIPISQVSLAFITIILSIFNVLSPIQQTALILFFLIPPILTFLCWLADRGSFSKYFHLPIFVFIISYVLFVVVNVYLGNILNLEMLVSTFLDFLFVFFFAISTSIITILMMSRFFPSTKRLHEIKNKKLKVLIVVMVSVFVPIIILVVWNAFAKLIAGGEEVS